MNEKQLIVLFVLLAIVGVTIFWWFQNQRGSQNRGSEKYVGPTASSRASDLKLLTPQEEGIAKQAQKLIAKGQVKQAAHMLEQIGLHRHAITALERAHLVDDAARVLLRMQKPGRAAVLYARNGFWKEAAQCHILAGMPLEAANCLKEAAFHREAAEIFLKENHFTEAADSFQTGGYFLDASRAWTKALKRKNASDCLVRAVNEASSPAEIGLTSDEFDLLFEAAKAGNATPTILAVLSSSSKIQKMISEALGDNNRALAFALFEKSPPHIASTLMSDINVQSQEAKLLASIFHDAGQYRYAAMLFEQSGEFKSAADAFEKAGDIERANYCLERIGGAKLKQKTNSANPETTPDSPAGNFIIETAEHQISHLPTPPKTIQLQAIDPLPKGPSGDTLTDDEARLVRRDWLFDGCSEDELDSITGLFAAIDLKSGDSVTSGTNESFLVLMASGTLKSDEQLAESGEWLCPEVALSGGQPIIWTADTPSRALAIRGIELDQLLRQDAELTRTVYTNLTHRLLRLRHNPPKGIAV